MASGKGPSPSLEGLSLPMVVQGSRARPQAKSAHYLKQETDAQGSPSKGENTGSSVISGAPTPILVDVGGRRTLD